MSRSTLGRQPAKKCPDAPSEHSTPATCHWYELVSCQSMPRHHIPHTAGRSRDAWEEGWWVSSKSDMHSSRTCVWSWPNIRMVSFCRQSWPTTPCKEAPMLGLASLAWANANVLGYVCETSTRSRTMTKRNCHAHRCGRTCQHQRTDTANVSQSLAGIGEITWTASSQPLARRQFWRRWPT